MKLTAAVESRKGS